MIAPKVVDGLIASGEQTPGGGLLSGPCLTAVPRRANQAFPLQFHVRQAYKHHTPHNGVLREAGSEAGAGGEIPAKAVVTLMSSLALVSMNGTARPDATVSLRANAAPSACVTTRSAALRFHSYTGCVSTSLLLPVRGVIVCVCGCMCVCGVCVSVRA